MSVSHQKDLNPNPGMLPQCAVCNKKLQVKDQTVYRPFVGKHWKRSKFRVEFIYDDSKNAMPYMDLCPDCYRKVTTKMRILKYFQKIIREDEKLG